MALALALTSSALAQHDAPPPTGTQPDAAAAIAAAQQWLAGDGASSAEPAVPDAASAPAATAGRKGLDAVVAGLLDAAPAGIEWLGASLRDVAAAPTTARARAVRSLATHVVLEFLRRTHAAEMTFVGQYAPLQPLQPFAADLLFVLLLETPQWYPLDFRVRLWPALRDLQPKPPAPARLDGVFALAEDEAQSLALRRAAAALLWQWGHRAPAQTVLVELQLASGEGDAEDRVRTTLDLAHYLVMLQEYRRAATAFTSAEVLAPDAGVQLPPIVPYSAACVHALLGDAERGIAALQRCVDRLAAPELDASLRLERVLFERDPEIALLRRDPRFAALLARAFPNQPGSDAAAAAREPDSGRRRP